MNIKNRLKNVSTIFERQYEAYAASLSPAEKIKEILQESKVDKSCPKAVKVLKQITPAEMADIEKYGIRGFSRETKNLLLKAITQDYEH